jgi:DNA repair exonuclease SbcCD nuclease subunit
MAGNPVSRLDNIRAVQYKKLSFVLDWCKKNGSVLLQAGDFFDSPRSWYVLPEVVGLLKRQGVPVYCVFGQHDTYFYSEKTRDCTSLGILAKFGLVNILDKVPTKVGDIQLYGASFGEPVPEPTIAGFSGLVIHAPICVDPLWSKQQFIHAKKFMDDNSEYNFVLAGDIHREFSGVEPDGRFIINTGPMIRKTAEKYSFEHKPNFAVIDTDDLNQKRVEIPHKAAEHVLSRRHINKAERDDAILSDFVGAIQEDYNLGVDYIANVAEVITKNNVEKPVTDVISEIMSISERS